MHKDINFIKQSRNLKDISTYIPFHFHPLQDRGKNKHKGKFSIDVKGRNNKERIILEPLNSNRMRYERCNIDETGDSTYIVIILEVSKHYE